MSHVRSPHEQHADLNSYPLRLSLGAGTYPALGASTSTLDASFKVSEIRLEAAGDGAVNLESSGQRPLLSVYVGAPPLTLQGLTLRGAVHIEANLDVTHTIDGCTFDGSTLGGARRALGGGHPTLHPPTLLQMVPPPTRRAGAGPRRARPSAAP